MITRKLAMLVAFALVLGFSVDAHAAFFTWRGTVTGRFTHLLVNGGYCPDGRDCTGSNYTQAKYNTFAPIMNGKVYVYRVGSGSSISLVGAGTTDSNGNYTVNWTYSGLNSSGMLFVTFEGQQKDGVFSLRNSSGGLYNWRSPTVSMSPNRTVNVGETRIGASNLPDLQTNLYDAAHMTWWYGMMGSNKLFTDFTGVQMQGVFEGGCRTCASGPSKYVRISPGFALHVVTVSHEMGHVASYLLNPRKTTGDYCYDGANRTYCTWPDVFCCEPAGIGSHSFNTVEWGTVAFEEGFASLFAAVALNQQYAPAPHVCVGNQRLPCPEAYYNMEPSSGIFGVASACVSESRWELSTTRYLWDVYDSVVDSYDPAGKASDTFSAAYWSVYEVIRMYGAGTGDMQTDEQLNAARDSFDDRDGFNNYDYVRMSSATLPWPLVPLGDTSLQYSYNCGFMGTNGVY